MRLFKMFGLMLALAVPAGVARADFVPFSVPAGTVGNQTFGGSLGEDFTVGSGPIGVTSLGAFDSGGTGFAGTAGSSVITVQIYNVSTMTQIGQALAFNSVNPGTLLNGYRYLTLATPFNLLANTTYTVVASGFTGSNTVYNSYGGPTLVTSSTGNGSITFGGTNRYGASGQFPTTIDGGPAARYAAGSFQFVSVPEPAGMVLMGLGALGLMGVGYRRRSAA